MLFMSTKSPRLHRFKFTLRGEKQFNHSIYVDIMTPEKKPVLYVVVEETRYHAARWVRSVSTAEIWNSICLACIECYLGPPDVIVTDAANALTSNAFCNNTGLLQIQAKPSRRSRKYDEYRRKVS